MKLSQKKTKARGRYSPLAHGKAWDSSPSSRIQACTKAPQCGKIPSAFFCPGQPAGGHTGGHGDNFWPPLLLSFLGRGAPQRFLGSGKPEMAFLCRGSKHTDYFPVNLILPKSIYRHLRLPTEPLLPATLAAGCTPSEGAWLFPVVPVQLFTAPGGENKDRPCFKAPA